MKFPKARRYRIMDNKIIGVRRRVKNMKRMLRQYQSPSEALENQRRLIGNLANWNNCNFLEKERHFMRFYKKVVETC